MTPRGRLAAVLSTALAAAALSGCPAPDPPVDEPAGASDGVGGALVVLAAASLTESFGRIETDVEAAHPGLEVTISYGASSALAAQILDGAPADVFAAANSATMTRVTDAGAATDPREFATNTLQIAVPPGNPGRVSGLADFADPDRTFALCAPQVPCGSAADRVFAAAGVVPRPDTLESDAKAALQKVVLGEVDAALVYATDVRAAGPSVTGVAFPEADRALNVYPIARLAASRNPAAADAFVDQVLGAQGRAVLEEAGFGAPT